MGYLKPNMGRYVVDAPPGSYGLSIDPGGWGKRYAVKVEECGTQDTMIIIEASARRENRLMRPAADDRSIPRGYLGRRSVLLVTLAAIPLLAATFGAQPAHACSCTSAPLEKRLRNAEAVFTGVALDAG